MITMQISHPVIQHCSVITYAILMGGWWMKLMYKYIKTKISNRIQLFYCMFVRFCFCFILFFIFLLYNMDILLRNVNQTPSASKPAESSNTGFGIYGLLSASYGDENRLSWDGFDPLLVAEASFALANVLSFLGIMHSMVILGKSYASCYFLYISVLFLWWLTIVQKNWLASGSPFSGERTTVVMVVKGWALSSIFEVSLICLLILDMVYLNYINLSWQDRLHSFH